MRKMSHIWMGGERLYSRWRKDVAQTQATGNTMTDNSKITPCLSQSLLITELIKTTKVPEDQVPTEVAAPERQGGPHKRDRLLQQKRICKLFQIRTGI